MNENYIHYHTNGMDFNFPTIVSFNDGNNDVVARRVYLAVASNRDENIRNGVFPIDPSIPNMTDEELSEWLDLTDIVFVDVANKRKLTMTHMSDLAGNYNVERL